MRQITETLYQFGELSEEVRNQLIIDNRDNVVEMNFENFQYDVATTLKDKYGLENCTINYSISYQQGDGFHFDVDSFLSLQIIALIKERAKEDGAPNIVNVILDYLVKQGYKITCKADRRFYEYAARGDVNYASDVAEGEIADDYCFEHKTTSFSNSHITAVAHTVLNYARDIYMRICKEFEHQGYECYKVSDQEVIDYLANDEYYADGRRYVS